MSTILEDFSNELANVSEHALRSLVQIRRGGRSIGSGAIWHTDGLIVTNAHVVAGGRQVADDVRVRLADGRELAARVLAIDEQADLAALRVETSDLPAIDLGDSHQLQPGQLVIALGTPYGVTGGATIGTVVGIGDSLGETRQRGNEWLVASLHLRPGHSGGPMVDARGRLVGINTMMNGSDVGIAVPVHVAKAFLRQALERGSPNPPPATVMV
jgi:serine protease Do